MQTPSPSSSPVSEVVVMHHAPIAFREKRGQYTDGRYFRVICACDPEGKRTMWRPTQKLARCAWLRHATQNVDLVTLQPLPVPALGMVEALVAFAEAAERHADAEDGR